MVRYVVFNSSATTSYDLVLKARRGLTALTGVGLCGNAFTLKKKRSCILALKINAAKMANPTQGGPIVCKKNTPKVCFSPMAKDQLHLTRETLVSFKPLSPVQLTVPSNRSAKIYYLITNFNKSLVQLTMKTIPGVQSLSGISGPVPYCATKFKLNKAKTCVLVLELTGSKIANRITNGPYLCVKGTSKCYQPQVNKRLNITKGAATGMATIEAQEMFPISVEQGSSVQLRIQNTSPVTANNIKATLPGALGSGLQQTPATCAPLGKTQVCILTFTAVQNLALGTYSFTLEGSNTNTINGQIKVTNTPKLLPPTIESISPPTGLQQGNESITLSGKNLQPNPKIFLGNQQCTNVTGDDQTLHATTPSQFQGVPVDTPVNVKVKTDNGEYTSSNGFTYLAASPTCADNTKNGDESGIDCGGSMCAPCNDGGSCNADSDCSGQICNNGVCARAECGDSVITSPELCDDGNQDNFDGCSSSCLPEDGFLCSGQPSNCDDIDECSVNNGNCGAPESFMCINTRGSHQCVDIDECAANNGGCDANALCTNTVGGHSCTCSSGFTGDGSMCIDINECVTGNASCDTNAICSNTLGSYSCACKGGYSGDGFTCTMN